jgi:prolyl-tRNA synthetase
MRLSKLFTKTKKETPSGESAKNAQLLIQAGFIEKEMAGVYAYLPLGKKVIDKIVAIVKEEMNSIGGQEIQLTALQPKELWEVTGRWNDDIVDIWFKTKLNGGGEIGLGMSHEEPLTALLKNHITSYQDLPLFIYQVQTKFRNELRAKSGLMRGREFLMKDMYSFTRTEAEHQKLFVEAREAYERVFQRLGISDKTFFTTADGGIFSSDFSYEFQTLTDAGEDTIYLDRDKNVAINEEILSDEVLSKLGLNRDNLEVQKASEVGNIFNLGTKYSSPFDLNYLSEDNELKPVIMGCYGLGISRVMGLIAEVLSDDKGLVWPQEIAPARFYLINLGTDEAVIDYCNEVYTRLIDEGIEVLYDDREVHAGEKFADADLSGIPFRIVISNKTVVQKKVELKSRVSDTTEMLSLDKLIETYGVKL